MGRRSHETPPGTTRARYPGRDDRIPDAVVAVSGGGGHYRIDVVSAVFAGKSPLERQRLVLSAIKHLINGDRAPVHAVDELLTRTP